VRTRGCHVIASFCRGEYNGWKSDQVLPDYRYKLGVVSTRKYNRRNESNDYELFKRDLLISDNNAREALIPIRSSFGIIQHYITVGGSDHKDVIVENGIVLPYWGDIGMVEDYWNNLFPNENLPGVMAYGYYSYKSCVTILYQAKEQALNCIGQMIEDIKRTTTQRQSVK
jgi:hypothetical protein